MPRTDSVLRDRVAIVGIGQTAFGKGLPDTELSLACQAISAALDDAGIAPAEVDGLASFTMEPNREVDVARNVGLGDITFFSQIGYGGGASCATVLHAAMAIATGQCSTAVAWRARKRADKASRVWAQTPRVIDDEWQWSRPFGLLRPVDEVAVLMRRYMHEFGATREQLAQVALAFRKHANHNPAATMYDRKLSLDEYLSARWISEPLCLFDNCLESDGALAVVLVPAERARDLPHRPVYVHAGAQGLPRQHQSMVSYFNDDPLRGPSWAATPILWRDADFGPGDLDVAQIYDAFSPLVLLSLEGYGICGRGEAAAFAADGELEWPHGRLPTNTSGGSMSEAYVHGFNLITEGVRQLRGTSTCQVDDAHTCLVTSGEAVPTSALLLRS
jgi:acetyl-CoA acetyltransferase